MYLPSPPTDEEKLNYTKPNGRAIAPVGLLCLSIFLYTSYHFCAKYPWLWIYAAFCFVYFLNVSFCSFGSLFARELDLEEHARILQENPDLKPVDVLLPSCGEDLQILANQFRAMSQIDYPSHEIPLLDDEGNKIPVLDSEGKPVLDDEGNEITETVPMLTVWVLDDKGDEQVRILAELHGFKYLSRPNKGELKKAGNLRYAFERSKGEIILVLDADFAARPDILRETVPYFAADPNLGILQTPQYFVSAPGQTPIQRGATYLQEVFYRLIQNFRNEWGASVCCGSNALYRRAALAPYGGAAAVERSEDINTGLNVLRDGWSIKYLPLNLAMGLSPDTVRAFFNQQYRWCSGSLDLITTRLFWTQPNVSPLGKASYFLSILYYLTSGFGVLLFSLPSLVNAWFMPSDLAVSNYSLVFPATAALVAARAMWALNDWGPHVLITSMTAGFTHLVSLIDVAFGDIAPWVPTGAVSSAKSRFDRVVFAIATLPFLQFSLLVTGLVVHHVPFRRGLSPALWLGFQVIISMCAIAQIAKDEGWWTRQPEEAALTGC